MLGRYRSVSRSMVGETGGLRVDHLIQGTAVAVDRRFLPIGRVEWAVARPAFHGSQGASRAIAVRTDNRFFRHGILRVRRPACREVRTSLPFALPTAQRARGASASSVRLFCHGPLTALDQSSGDFFSSGIGADGWGAWAGNTATGRGGGAAGGGVARDAGPEVHEPVPGVRPVPGGSSGCPAGAAPRAGTTPAPWNWPRKLIHRRRRGDCSDEVPVQQGQAAAGSIPGRLTERPRPNRRRCQYRRAGVGAFPPIR